MSAIGVCLLIVLIMSMFKARSMASFWSVIGQLQMFLLLLLTNASVPYDVKHVVTGFKFAANFPSYIDFNAVGFYRSAVEPFKFSLTNERLDALNIQYDSSIYSMSPTIAFAVLAA